MMMRTLLFLTMALALVGCDRSCTRPDSELGIRRQHEPFYYYGDERIYLDIDPTKLVISSDSTVAMSTDSLLTGTGVRVDSVSNYPAHPARHWTVWLHPRTDELRAQLAAKTLRMSDGIEFASNAYISRKSRMRLLVINEFIVRFRESTSLDAIADLNARVGTRILRQASWSESVYILAFPEGLPYTPLEVAAYYDEQAIVEHSTPNFGWHRDPWR